MTVNDIVQYTSRFLPYILLFTQAPILVWLDGTIIIGMTTPVLYLQPLIPPKRFDIFPPLLGGAQKV